MNLATLSRYVEMLMKPSTPTDVVDSWIKELKMRASSIEGHYRGKLENLKFAKKKETPAPGLMGPEKGIFISFDIEKGYQFQTEYNMVRQEFGGLGYNMLKTAESIDPSALSNLMVMVFEKRKAFEDRAMTLLGSVNTVLKSIISITYELRELDRNLQFYNLMESGDKEKKEAAGLALKRIFVDQVDARKRGASLAALSAGYSQGQGGAGFIDLVASFYKVKSLRDIENMQRNDEYKDILKNRYIEYEEWVKISGSDLRQRKAMLLQYLKSQVSSYKMYSEWAAEALTILKRINLTGTKDAKGYMSNTKQPDIMETAKLSLEVIGNKPIYLGEYSVENAKIFGNKGVQLPVSVNEKFPASPSMRQGPRENSRSFIHDYLTKYGPKVISAIEVSLTFVEKQLFLKGAIQDKPQYYGTLDINVTPYCFSVDEWYLFTKAQEARISKTVFSELDKVSVSSLSSIQKELDKYIEEADKATKPKKNDNSYAFIDIYRSFKDDILGINKAMSAASPHDEDDKHSFKPELYEIELSHRKFGAIKNKRAIEAGMFISMNDAYLIYNEFKRRKNLMTPLSKFDNPLF
ncbi:MAG: hypothetical protein M1433_00530 [Candidatus Parvarchaeota archaeon]|nr:hypothetical protein [Candidatus Parvarchaeota archaeon]